MLGVFLFWACFLLLSFSCSSNIPLFSFLFNPSLSVMILHLLKLIRYFLNYNGQLDSYFLKILLLLGSVGLTFIRTEAFFTNLVFGTVLFLRTLHFLEKTCHVLHELFLGRFRVLPNERVLQGSFERNPLVRITIGSQSEEVLELLRQVLFLKNCPELVGILT